MICMFKYFAIQNQIFLAAIFFQYSGKFMI